MSTATARPAQQNATTQNRASSLLEQILEQPVSERMRAVHDALEKRIQSVEEVLPDPLKSHAARLVKRAELTFNRRPELHGCTPQSLVRCVIEAAEIGLAIDGKLCYAVKYSRKLKGENGERDRWIDEAQLQIDYKGLIVVARRSGQIIDCYGDVVREGDRFEAFRDGPESVLKHSYDLETQRGEPIGAYCIVTFPNGRWRYEMMPVSEIEAIRKRSKAANNGPWVTDWGEMAKKTVARRTLKLYCDDPALGMALEIDERGYEGERHATAPTTRVGRSSLNDTLASPQQTHDRPASQRTNGNGDTHDEPEPQDAPQSDDEREAPIIAFLDLCQSAKDLGEIAAALENLPPEMGRDLTPEESATCNQAMDGAAKRLKPKKGQEQKALV